MRPAWRLAPENRPTRPCCPWAYSFAREVYPEMMRSEINRFPWWLPWIFPQPLYSRPQKRLLITWITDSVFIGWPSSLACFIPVPFFHRRNPSGHLLLVAVLLITLGFLVFLDFTFRASPSSLAQETGGPPVDSAGSGAGGLAILMEDDERFSLALQRFLADHQVPYSYRSMTRPANTCLRRRQSCKCSPGPC